MGFQPMKRPMAFQAMAGAEGWAPLDEHGLEAHATITG